MNTLHHLVFASALANGISPSRRERRWIMACAILPDLDGATFWDRDLWETVHHTFGHNVFFAATAACVGAALARPGNRARLATWSAFTVLVVHYVIDLCISATWPMRPLWPLSHYDVNLGNFVADPERLDFILRVPVQWTLVALALVLAVRTWRRHGRSFLELVSSRADQLLAGYLSRMLQGARCRDCAARAGFGCASCDATICGSHAKIAKWEATCSRCQEDPVTAS